MLYYFITSFCFIIFKLFFGLKVYGRKNIPGKGGFILASNHRSFLDPLALGAACPRRLNFMARHDLFRNAGFAWLISKVGAFPVKRHSADLSALKEAMRRLRSGKVLGIFPEGGRQAAEIYNAPQAGIGFLAAKVDVPVIPVFIKGTELALPKGAKVIRRADIRVAFGRPVPLEKTLPYEILAQRIMEGINEISLKGEF